MGERARMGLRRHVRLLYLPPRYALQLAHFVDETSFGWELGSDYTESGREAGRLAVFEDGGAICSIE